MDLVKGQGEVFPKSGKSFDPALIPKAVKDAGFTATEVEVTAEGTLTRKNNLWELDVPGLSHSFSLAGGTQWEPLKERADLVGNKIWVRGKLQAPLKGQPPGLTVEEFRPVR